MRKRMNWLIVVFAALAAVTIPTTASATTTSYGPYEFVNDHSHMCVDVPGGNPADKVQVQLWDCWRGDMQMWWLDFNTDDYNGTAYYHIRNVRTNECLDVPYGDPTNGLQVQQMRCWDGQMQQWQLVQLGNNLVELKNRMSQKCLDDPFGSLNRGTILQQWDCWGGDMQRWITY
jgi:hypothetical protein